MVLFFFFFLLSWVFVALRGLSLVGGERRLLSCGMQALLIAVASLMEHGLSVHSSAVVALGF